MAGARGIGSAAFVLTKREQYQTRSGPKTNSPRSTMHKTKACAAGSGTSLLTSVTIPRRDPTDRDMQIEILLCGICHSDLHYARDEWHDVMSTVYPYGGYSDSIVVDEGFVLRIPANVNLAGTAPLLCAGITTYSPMRHWGVTKGKKVGVVGLGGLGHMGVKFAHAFGAHHRLHDLAEQEGGRAPPRRR